MIDLLRVPASPRRLLAFFLCMLGRPLLFQRPTWLLWLARWRRLVAHDATVRLSRLLPRAPRVVRDGIIVRIRRLWALRSVNMSPATFQRGSWGRSATV